MFPIIIIGCPSLGETDKVLARMGHVIHHTTQDFEGVLVAEESKMIQIVNYPSRTEFPLNILLAPVIETPFIEQPAIRYVTVVMLLIHVPIRGDWMHLRWRPPWQRLKEFFEAPHSFYRLNFLGVLNEINYVVFFYYKKSSFRRIRILRYHSGPQSRARCLPNYSGHGDDGMKIIINSMNYDSE